MLEESVTIPQPNEIIAGEGPSCKIPLPKCVKASLLAHLGAFLCIAFPISKSEKIHVSFISDQKGVLVDHILVSILDQNCCPLDHKIEFFEKEWEIEETFEKNRNGSD